MGVAIRTRRLTDARALYDGGAAKRFFFTACSRGVVYGKIVTTAMEQLASGTDVHGNVATWFFSRLSETFSREAYEYVEENAAIVCR